MTNEITYRTYNPEEIQARYACPFCIRVATDTAGQLLAHVGACDFYHALDDNLPVSPASAIIIDPDIPYTLEEYLADEILYFEIMKSVSGIWPPAEPADLAGAEEYFANMISESANTLPITAHRKKNLVVRLITTFYKLPQHIMQTMMMEMYGFDVKEDTAI
jgi:hypothetical protein